MDNEVWLLRMRFGVFYSNKKWILEITYDTNCDALYFQQVSNMIPEKDVFKAFDKVACIIGRSITGYNNDGDGQYMADLNSLLGKGRVGRGGFYRCFGAVEATENEG